MTMLFLIIHKAQAQDAVRDLVHYRQKLQPVYKTTDKEAAANPISSFLRCVDRVSDITSCSAFVLESSVTI
eukprot:scaffold8036_cov99-Skeletonema_marinoi.AAC.1